MLSEYAIKSENILESDESAEIEEKVIRIIRSALPAELVGNISPATSLDDLGISSINFIQIIVVCEEEFNIVFDEAMISPVFFNRVANLIFYIEEKLNS
ncbi:acyl carrier protein [Paenibacillus thiaminolyticus]|nr:acyl carrier protein [Paenibacillus thiaminolyticus]